MNPILPSQYYIPDVEARKDEDGNIYLYGSKDCCGNDESVSYTHLDVYKRQPIQSPLIFMRMRLLSGEIS